jgi:TetR/AcrR family transcriptional regulator, regulator of autoinduction and epiphytic fitness
MDPVSAGATADGRTLRAERTRSAVAAAYLDLLTEGDLRPTADRIAERAGVSPRSVFKHFPDREALFGEVAELQERRVREMVGELPDPAAPLEQRIDAFVDQRARFHEFIAPVRRAALLSEPFSDVVASRLKLTRAAGAAVVDHVFATELAERDRRGRADLHDALGAIAAWPTWESLRRHQGLSAPRAQSVLRAMLAAQLKAE